MNRIDPAAAAAVAGAARRALGPWAYARRIPMSGARDKELFQSHDNLYSSLFGQQIVECTNLYTWFIYGVKRMFVLNLF